MARPIVPTNAHVNPQQTLAELKALRTLTTNPATGGAMRVAWTDIWLKSRNWLLAQVADLDRKSVV